MSDTQTKQTTFQDLISGDTPVLIDFFATWCGPCQMVPPILQEVANKLGDKVKIVKIDVDRNPAVAQAYGIQSIPTIMLFKNGEAVWRQAGVVPANMLVEVIQQHMQA